MLVSDSKIHDYPFLLIPFDAVNVLREIFAHVNSRMESLLQEKRTQDIPVLRKLLV